MALRIVEPEKKTLHTTGTATVKKKGGKIRKASMGDQTVGGDVKEKMMHSIGNAGKEAMAKNMDGGEEVRDSAEILAAIAASRKVVYRSKRQEEMAKEKNVVQTKSTKPPKKTGGGSESKPKSKLKTGKKKRPGKKKELNKKRGKRRKSGKKKYSPFDVKGRMLAAFKLQEESEDIRGKASGAKGVVRLILFMVAHILGALAPVIAVIAAIVAIIGCIVMMFLYILYASPLAIFFPLPDTGTEDPRTVLSGYYQEFNAEVSEHEDDGDVVTYQNEKDGVPLVNFRDTLYVYMMLYSDGTSGYVMDDEAKEHMKEVFNEMNYIEETEVEKEVKAGDSLGEVFVTAYCPCQSCSGPHGHATASGATARENHTVAVDYKNPIVPMGAKVLIEGREYTVEDTGDLHKYSNEFDVFFEHHADTEKFGRKKIKVYLAGGSDSGEDDDESSDAGDDSVDSTDPSSGETETVKGDGIIVHNLTVEDYIVNHSELNEDQVKLLRDMISDKTIYYGGGGLGGAAVQSALTKVGCHYDQGRRMEEGYYDCSSLVYRTYLELGLELPLTAAEQGRYCYEHSLLVNFEDLQPGDLIFYSYKKNGRFKNISHVAMYIGDGMMVHAANPSRGVVTDPIRTSSVVFYGRPA